MNAGAATLAMLAVSYADVILARDVLPAAQAGRYAVGAVLTKGALWAPGVVTILALPMLARRSRRALVAALACVLVCGAVLVGAAAWFGGLAVGLVGGGGYGELAGLAAGFAGVGALYAVVFVFVNDEIAARVRFPAAPLWLALVGLSVAVHLVAHPTVGRLLTVSLVTAALTALVTGASALRRGSGGVP